MAGAALMKMLSPRGSRLIAIAVIASAVPHLALASDSASGPALKVAMGPTSAAVKNQGASTTFGSGVANCAPTEGTCAKSHYRLRRKRAASK
jgi:hypothetical protein